MRSPDEARAIMRAVFDIRPGVYYAMRDVATEVVSERCRAEGWEGWNRTDVSIQMLGMIAYGWVERYDNNRSEALDKDRWYGIR